MSIRAILKKEGLLTKSARSLYPEDLKIGKTYSMGYRSSKFEATFLGWSVVSGAPEMSFSEPGEGRAEEWRAYMFHGVMCVGSSADPLKIYGELP